MFRFLACAVLVAASCLQTGIVGSRAVAAEPPLRVIVKKEADRAEISFADGAHVVTINSKSGIGAAALRFSAREPVRTKIRLRLDGLEHLSVQSPVAKIALAVDAAGSQRISLAAPNGDETPLTDDDERWFAVKRVSAEPPAAGTWFEFEIPAALLRSPHHGAPASLELHWIDFYRG